MRQFRRDEHQCKEPSLFEQNSAAASDLFGQHSHGAGAMETSPLGSAWGDPAPWRAHWAEPETKLDAPSGFSGFLKKTGATALAGWDSVKGGAQWLGGQVGKSAAWIGDQVSESWQTAKNGIGETSQDWRRAVEQEGWGEAFLDSRGALDRQRAQRELGDRFQVMPNDFVGPRLSNQVTEDEYAKIARTYSDVRLGRGDLAIDASAHKSGQQRDAYQAGALEDIAALMQTRSGRHEVEQLHNNVLRDENRMERCGILGVPLPHNIGWPIHRQTTLVPNYEKDGTLSTFNGYAHADDKGDARTILGDASLGAPGPGTNVHLHYNPGVRVGEAFPEHWQKNPWLAEMRSDILLAHEMNHTIQQTQGMVDNRKIRATDNALNREDPAMAHDDKAVDEHGIPIRRVEHQAVGSGLYADTDMTENRYRDERRNLAAAQGKGLLNGDATLHQRDVYDIWQ